jgi:hypothetical protein
MPTDLDEAAKMPPHSASATGRGSVTVPPTPAVLGILGLGLAAGLVASTIQLLTPNGSSFGVQVVFAVTILIFLSGIAWLIYSIGARDRFVHHVKTKALDTALDPGERKDLSVEEVIAELKRAEKELTEAGAYRAASEVAAIRRQLSRAQN